MFESLRRAQLTREGFSCGRTRRKHQDDDFWDALRCHPSVTGVVALGFVIGILVLMQTSAASAEGIARPGPTKWLYAIILSLSSMVHLHVINKDLTRDNRAACLIFGALLFHLATTVALLRYTAMQSWSGALLATSIPHAIAPLILSVTLGRKLGMFAVINVSLLGAVIVPLVNPLTWLASSLLIGTVAVLATRRVRRRNRFLFAGLYVGIAAAVLGLLLAATEGTTAATDWVRVLRMPLIVGLLTGLLVSGLLPLFESIFGVITDITWLELADLNHPLMRRLSIEAPGTYHHSLVVANLAEAAAESINANASLARVCSYFHDIGKLSKPE